MTLKDMLRYITPIEKLKVVDFMTMDTLYDNVYPADIVTLAGASGVDLHDWSVYSMGSLLDWNRNTTYIVIMVKSNEVKYGE